MTGALRTNGGAGAAISETPAEVAAALSIEALLGATRAFHPSVHAQRPYAGAIATAAHLRELLAGSTLTLYATGEGQTAPAGASGGEPATSY